MDFYHHPLAGTFLSEDTYIAWKSKYTFMVTKHEDGKWYTSWQDQVNGGSASNTIEGPFQHRHQAEANCRQTLRVLLLRSFN